jgi:hypothetical protein
MRSREIPPKREPNYEQISAEPTAAVDRRVCDEVSSGCLQCSCEVL